MAQKLQQQLRELGAKLENPPASKDGLIKLLKQAATCLSELDQSPSPPIMDSMQPFLNAIAKHELLKHQDRDVKVLVAACICEITRITAPEAPYSDDVLRDIFHLIVGTFGGLDDINSPLFGRRVVILETLARYRSCVVMLDLECDDLVNEMFRTFYSVASDDHPESVLTSMQTIMVLLLDESEDLQENLVLTLLSVLGRGKSDVSMAARRLAMNVIEHCAGKLEPCIKQFLISSMSGDQSSLNIQLDHHEVIYDIYQCAPQILCGIIPYVTGELLTDQLDVRLKAVKFLGDLFALPERSIAETFKPLFAEFLKRLTDRVVEVRISVIENVKNCLLSNPFRAEAPDIMTALCDRLLDYDENVRKHVVAAIFDVACHSLKSVPAETARLVAERLRDKSLIVKRYTMERLAELYRLYCSKYSIDSITADEFDWMPGRILRSLYDRDFRAETIEDILCGSLPPAEFSIKDKVKHWMTVFSVFEKVDIKALEKLLAQKQRLQQEMQKYLSLRETYRDGDALELQKRILVCFRTMSRLFGDTAKAEEGFRILNHLKDANIWKILTSLLDPSTSYQQAYTYREDLLKILGEKHPLYDFLDTLSMKCSYLLFNKEYVKEILLEVSTQKTAGNSKLTLSCLNLLVILSSFCPLFLMGCEEELINLLKEEDEIIKEGIVHVLARAGGTIREQLARTTSSVDLLLERLCLEGSRKQAKYSVQALAAITKDDGLKSLSVLYKKLVDILETKTHLPAVLQSLGCIAQTAMPVFETREGEIVGFLTRKILECGSDTEDEMKTSWDEPSELCLLKVFGIKTLVKSYLPVKDSHLRPGIENLLGILQSLLSFGEVSEDIKSSTVDRAHLRLAAAKAVLRLSKFWDQKISIDVFYLTLRLSQDAYPQARKLFLSKVHQYIKERLLDAKYACAFLFNVTGSHPLEFKEDKHNLMEVVQMLHQMKARQLSVQRDMNSSTTYPEYILVYLVHAIAHHPSCPNVDECKEVQLFESIYRQLHLFLSVLMHGYDGVQAGAASNKEKEILSTVLSIFQSIKCSEDSVDRMKSKNSHAICDLGLAITKRLTPNEVDSTGLTGTVPLPSALYQPLEKNEGDDSEASEEKSWLADEKVLTHFESLKIENTEIVHNGAGRDEQGLEDSDIDGAELPLRKMMKRLKSRRIKKKKVAGKDSLSLERNNTENDFDIMGMVRKINLENQGAMNTEHGKLGNDHKHFVSGEKAEQNGKKKDSELRKKKKRKTSDIFSTPVPTRKRSPFGKDSRRRSHSKNSVKGLEKASRASPKNTEISSLQSAEIDEELHNQSEVKLSKEDSLVEPNDSDLVASHSLTSKSSSRRKTKGTMRQFNDTAHTEAIYHEPKESSLLLETDEKNTISNSKSSLGSIRKRKRRSIARLAKCSSEEAGKHNSDLVGCRLKVWWPMDKQFYEGMVQSYDPGKKKHAILYDDGDMEVLQLNKEKWEVIADGSKSRKQQKSSNVSPSRGMSPRQEKSMTHGVPRRNKNPTKKFRRKTIMKQNGENSHRPESNIDADSSDSERRSTSDLSDSHPHTISEANEINSDDPAEEQASPSEAMEEEPEAPIDLKEPDQEEKFDSSDGDATEDSDDEPLSMWKLRAAKVV